MIQMRFKAFTMIEILIVIAVIGALMAVVIPNISSVKTRSRDEKKVADIGVIESALNQYRQACGTYPYNSGAQARIDVAANNGVPIGTTCPGGVTFGAFLPSGFVADWNTILYYPLVRGGQTNYRRCTSYHLGITLSSSNAGPINRALNRGWLWTGSQTNFDWKQCGSAVSTPTAVPAFAADVYDTISPSPY